MVYVDGCPVASNVAASSGVDDLAIIKLAEPASDRANFRGPGRVILGEIIRVAVYLLRDLLASSLKVENIYEKKWWPLFFNIKQFFKLPNIFLFLWFAQFVRRFSKITVLFKEIHLFFVPFAQGFYYTVPVPFILKALSN